MNYFTPALLAKVVESTGFRVLRFGSLQYFPTSDNMWLLAERTGFQFRGPEHA